MYAMHYAITLPADYDMGIIRERIASKGPLLDTLPGLGLKAYLVRERCIDGSPVNQYATFYIWVSSEGMGEFLWGGRGFGGIIASFGRPPVHHWMGVACLAGSQAPTSARLATIREATIASDIDPILVVSQARDELADLASHPGACLVALAVDPLALRIVRFALWSQEPPADAGTRYEVAHLSKPEIDSILIVPAAQAGAQGRRSTV